MVKKAPEIQYNDPMTSRFIKFSNASDIYAYGIVLCELISGHVPHEKMEYDIVRTYLKLKKAKI